MRIKRFWGLISVLLMCAAQHINAAKVDTVMIRSNAMGKDVQTVIVTPQKATGRKAAACPVIYLLHGYSGGAKDYVSGVPELVGMADEYGVFFVCPDGENNWYWDSSAEKKNLYETFTAKELVNYIDTNYKTIPSAQNRAITGLSMGGQGALFLAFRHPDIFGAAGSMSGCMDICAFPDNWKISKLLGDFDKNNDVWNEYSLMNQVKRIKNGQLKIIFDCGNDDFFYDINCKFHQKLDTLGIEHDFILRPGIHDWNYWRNAIKYQVLFFSECFKLH